MRDGCEQRVKQGRGSNLFYSGAMEDGRVACFALPLLCLGPGRQWVRWDKHEGESQVAKRMNWLPHAWARWIGRDIGVGCEQWRRAKNGR